jgi:NIMA (never in mitosis gene a)-related kinase
MPSDERSTLNDFEQIAILGKGSFGSVSKVRRIYDNEFYVIKTISLINLSSKQQITAINEVRLLSQMDSQYIVSYHDSFIENSSLYIVMEFCNRGEAHKL